MTTKAQNSDHIFEIISEVLQPGTADDVRRVFLDAGAPPPIVVWSPERRDLRNSLLRQFYDACTALTRGRDHIPADEIQLEDFGALANWMMVVDWQADDSFTYVYYGGGIADAYGRDMTGKTVQSFGGYIASFFAAVYVAASQRKSWVYTEHEPPEFVFVRSWHRLIVPLAGGPNGARRFLVMNVPENELSSGLELLVDPVFVINENRDVVYCNEAAQSLFRLPRGIERGKSLSDLTGIELDTKLSPSEMLKNKRREDTTELAVRGSIVERLVMTTSAAQLRGKAFYVVIMRMLGA